jgi:hypothetical protein
MNPNEALQYLSQVGGDFARTLAPSAQGPTIMAMNQALAALQPLVEQAMAPRPLAVDVDLPDGVKAIRPASPPPGQPAP